MKEKIYNSNGNILYIYKTLKKYTDINHPSRVNEIIKYIKEDYNEDISSRTVRRDFKVLESKFDIVIDRVNDAYYMDYEDNDLDLSEIRCLIDMVNYSKFIDEKQGQNLTNKLISQLNENDKKQFKDYNKYMKGTKTKNKELFCNIQIIAENILNKHNIKFDYYKYNLKKEIENRKSFNISPLKILCDFGQYYLIGVGSDKKLLYFRLDRIKNISTSQQKYFVVSQDKINSFIDSTIGMFAGKKETVKAIVDNHVIDEVIEAFGIDTHIEKYDETNFVMETQVSLEGFKHWGLRHLEDAQIIYPQNLVDEISDILAKSSEKYLKGK